jgi:hypothetical protein
MFTNELKKGDKIRLRNGWDAKLEDNLKGNTRLCTVYGFCTEMGSVYSHDIVFKYNADGSTTKIEYTPSQLKLRQSCQAMGF